MVAILSLLAESVLIHRSKQLFRVGNRRETVRAGPKLRDDLYDLGCTQGPARLPHNMD